MDLRALSISSTLIWFISSLCTLNETPVTSQQIGYSK
jgi:hypothetical protein